MRDRGGCELETEVALWLTRGWSTNVVLTAPKEAGWGKVMVIAGGGDPLGD